MTPSLLPRRDATALPGDWRGLVVICSGTSWDGPYLSDRHLAERLTAYAPVLFVDLPISLLTPIRRPEYRAALREPRLRLIRDGLARLTPVVTPGMSRFGLRRLAMSATRATMGAAARRLGGDVEAVVVGSLDDLFGACGERQRMLWGTDDFAAAGELMSVSSRSLAAQETAQLAKADVITTVSEELAIKWRAASGKPVTVIPNGCDTAMFAEDRGEPEGVDLSGPIALFMGHLSERIDLACLEAVADRGISLLLVGPRQATFRLEQMEHLLARPNVQWVGPKAFEELPSYVGIAAVGLTPYADSAFNRASFPLKTLEYLAGGLPVVSTDLPSTRQLNTDLIATSSTAAEFGERVARVLANPVGPDFAARARAFAAGHDWDARVADIASLLGLERPMPPGQGPGGIGR